MYAPCLKKIKSKNFYVFPLREDYEKLKDSFLCNLHKCKKKFCMHVFSDNNHPVTFNFVINYLNNENDVKKIEMILDYFINYIREKYIENINIEVARIIFAGSAYILEKVDDDYFFSRIIYTIKNEKIVRLNDAILKIKIM